MALPLLAQSISSTTAHHIFWGTSLPATCNPLTGDVFFKTSAMVSPYFCDSTNHWTVMGSGGGGGTPASPNLSVQFNNGGAFGAVPNWFGNTAHKTMKIALVPDPTVPPASVLAGAGAGNVDNGSHCYTYGFQTATGGMTYPSTTSTVTVADNTVDGQVSVGFPVSADTRTAARALFRTKAGADCGLDANFFFLTTIGDNTTTAFTDNVPDSGLATLSSVGLVFYDFANTTATMVANNSEVPFLSDNGFFIPDGFFVGSTAGVPYIRANNGSGHILDSTAPGSAGALTNDGLGGLSYQPSGQTPCTFATLGSVLSANGQSCYCSDCTVTSGADNTCAGSGGGASVTTIAGANTCLI